MHHGGLLANPRFWVAVAFVIFFLLFGAKLWQQLAAMLDRRTNAIRTELEEAARLRREAETMLAEARRERDQTLGESKALLASAQAEAARLTEQAQKDAETATARRERMATDRIAAAEKAALQEVRLAAIDIATRAAGAVIARTMPADADAALVDKAIAGLPAALSPRRAA